MSISTKLKEAVGIFLTPLFEHMYSYEIDAWDDEFVVIVHVTENELSRTKLVRLYINNQDRQLQLTNIFIPVEYKNKGYGFGLIHTILQVANEMNYDLFIVDMVNSFYNRMIEKGAKRVVGYEDAVMVDDSTRLLIQR